MEIEKRYIVDKLPKELINTLSLSLMTTWISNIDSDSFIRFRYNETKNIAHIAIKSGSGLTRTEIEPEDLDFDQIKPLVKSLTPVYCTVGNAIYKRTKFDLKYMYTSTKNYPIWILEVEFDSEYEANSFNIHDIIKSSDIVEVTDDETYNFNYMYKNVAKLSDRKLAITDYNKLLKEYILNDN